MPERRRVPPVSPSDQRTSSNRRARPLRRWHLRLIVVGAAALGATGVIGSLLTARDVARHDADRSRQEATASAEEVGSTLRLALQRERDLAVSTSGYFLENPRSTNRQFAAWAQSVQAMERYPELLGVGEVVEVADTELSAFVQRVNADLSPVVQGPFAVLPPGKRSSYCFFTVGQGRTTGLLVPAGFDYCAGESGKLLLASRDAGVSNYQSVNTGLMETLTVQVPIYHGGATPSTVEARRGAFAGWVGLGFDPKLLLQTALRDRADTAVVLVFDDSLSEARFSSGRAVSDAQLSTIDLGDNWTVEVYGAVRDAGLFADRSSILVLVGGVLTSLLVAALVLVLGTGRARAWQLVGERTGELRHQALHDALTGLPNRALIMDRIDQLLARNRRHGTAGAALYLDLDDFKNVNDTLGHAAGDRLLVAVAARLQTALREADTIGRMGGDEFVILIDDVTTEATMLVAQRLMSVMHQPYDLDDALMPMTINTSVGIALGDRASGGELLRDADVALYQAKAAGKNRYELFCSEMQSQVSRRIDIEFELRSAVESGQFRVVYQPIYNLDDLALVGVEALLRWTNPKLGDVEPDEFIPILEQSGHIQEVGRWVLQTACAQMAEWHARGDVLKLSVNVSARQLDHDDIVEHIRDSLARTGLEPDALIVEVTETALMRNAAATAVRLEAIKALGVSIAVDDFGTGYSSLAYLQQFPVDCLKIDRRFTHAIESSPESKSLVNTLVQLGKDLGLRTLAEGVESTVEIEHLRHENVDEAQGFLLSRPLDPETLERLILLPLRPAQRPAERRRLSSGQG